MRKILALALIIFIAPALVHAAALVNINTADAAVLDTLPGIGPAKAAAIVEYRTAHGSFAQISDIQEVSGIKGATFAKIEALITVDGANSSVAAPAQSAQGAPTASPNTTSPATVLDTSLTTTSQTTTPTPASVISPQPTIAPHLDVSTSGITIANEDTNNALDLSHWQLVEEAKIFTFSDGTKVAAGSSVTFAPEVTGLEGAAGVSLLYPSGKVATTYQPSAVTAAVAAPVAPALRSLSGVGKPSPASARSQVRTSISAPVDATEPARAPATSTQIAAAGAAHAGSVLTSPWTLGFLGLLVFSGAAFIVL